MCSKEIRSVRLKIMENKQTTQKHPKERTKFKQLNTVGLVAFYHNSCNLGINPLKLVSKVEESHLRSPYQTKNSNFENYIRFQIL